jgi:dTDP-3-amino-3,4,6-trideoxy-alpha-D-glucopyranose N,N-dimethyltransferase
MSMYSRFARYYDALHYFKDYAAEVQKILAIIAEYRPAASSLLDVGCGTGSHLALLRNTLEVQGVDLSSDMLDIARRKCPDVPFHEGGLTDFELGRTFDVVICLFGSIALVQSPERLALALANLKRHLAPGGVLLVEPYFTPDSYWVGKITANFVDQPELKIAWMYVSERVGRISRLNNHYMVGTPQGVEEFEELHEIGLFTDEEYRVAFSNAGLRVRHDPDGLRRRGLYIATDH